MSTSYTIETHGVKPAIYPCPIPYKGTDGEGNLIDFNNYYMEYNGEPYYAISGEMHFSRIEERFWEDEIIKMKMAGITMISTYLFWIHHEEEKGVFDWSGNKNIRKFTQLCKKHNIFLILRIGPFSHGECRNGGFPDWMFGAPYDVRSNDEEYLFYVKRYLQEIGQQVKGLMFQDSGPVVSIQIENEYEHASSPWEPTTENSGEWTPSGNEGPSHLSILKKMAIEEGMITPLYSTTAWGGACAPVEEVLPLWGGYAYWPWIFYGDDIKEHPPTTEYIYKDFHNNDAPKYYNFDPEYPPEDFPFVCCEMGGGMANYYRYRFQLPFESVEASANVKTASGCNFLGYYMFHGGTNPKGKRVPYLNECALPKISYDYQGAIGEYGQIRDSYRRVKLLHYFYKSFEKQLCNTKTVLPKEAADMDQRDRDTLRYCVRVNGDSGFVFLNNFQDHVEMKDQKDFSVTVKTDTDGIRIPAEGGMSLSREASCILPFNLDMDGILLRYATAQPILRTSVDGVPHYFFFIPEGMEPEFQFEGMEPIYVPKDRTSRTVIKGKDGKELVLCVLSREDSKKLWIVKRDGSDLIILSEETVLDDNGTIRVESIGKESGTIAVFPPREKPLTAGSKSNAPEFQGEVFTYYNICYGKSHIQMEWEDVSSREKESSGTLKRPVIGSPITSGKIVNARAKIKITPESFEQCKQILMKVDYMGDIGYAFTDSDLINDNFCNGATWEFGIKAYEKEILEKGLYLYVSPQRKGGRINSDSEMAARFEVFDEAFAEISRIEAVPVFDCLTDL